MSAIQQICRLKANLCQQFSKFVLRKKILRRHVWKLVLSAIQQFSKSAIFLLTKQILILLSKSCQQFSKSVSRKQILSAILSCKQILLQTSLGWILRRHIKFTLARQRTEMISLPAGAFLFLIYDSLRIAGPSIITRLRLNLRLILQRKVRA